MNLWNETQRSADFSKEDGKEMDGETTVWKQSRSCLATSLTTGAGETSKDNDGIVEAIPLSKKHCSMMAWIIMQLEMNQEILPVSGRKSTKKCIPHTLRATDIPSLRENIF